MNGLPLLEELKKHPRGCIKVIIYNGYGCERVSFTRRTTDEVIKTLEVTRELTELSIQDERGSIQ